MKQKHFLLLAFLALIFVACSNDSDNGNNQKDQLLPQVKFNDFTFEGESLLPSYIDENDILLQQYADMIKLGLLASNAGEAVKDVKAVVFTGGEDIEPTLLSMPEPWHGIEAEKDYNATRDISDYLTMAYCLDGAANASQFMSYDEALVYFKALVEQAKLQ